MKVDPWLPIGHVLPEGGVAHVVLFAGQEWQIVENREGGRILLFRDELASRWFENNLINSRMLSRLPFGTVTYWMYSSEPEQVLCPVVEGRTQTSKAEALAFAHALRETRDRDPQSSLHDAIFVEELGRLLPTYDTGTNVDDDVVLGLWLTGGIRVSAKESRTLGRATSWLDISDLEDVVREAGLLVVDEVRTNESRAVQAEDAPKLDKRQSLGARPNQAKVTGTFELAGRPDLAAFFNEHIVDIVKNSERYKALGIDFPSAVVLHGPPGCGKSFAVEKLVEFLQWPSFQIDASSIGSPYIHETSKKVAQVFKKAANAAPSALIIDEMEAFLADREIGSGHHRVEEVAEFLRRIPEATKRGVLVFAMTNRVDMIDPAILRRGRFDHVIKVDFASEAEIKSLLEKLLASLPKQQDVTVEPLARRLAGRPLSDVTFVVREGARLAARGGRDKLDQECLLRAMDSAPARPREGSA